VKTVLWVAAVAGLVLGLWVASERVTAQEESKSAVEEAEKNELAGAALAREEAEPTEAPEKPAPEKVSADHERDIRRFLKVTRAESQGRQMMEAMFGQFKRAMPQVPADYWDKFLARVDPAEFTDMLVSIYGKHISHDDIKALTVFFESPLGQRMLDAQPAITADSVKAGMAWGQRIGAQVMEDLKKEQTELEQ